MSSQLLEFSIKHIGLISALLIALGALGVVEYLQWVLGSEAISPALASLLMNRYDASVFDLREKAEFLKAHVPQATHIGPHLQEAFFKQLEPLKPIILVTSEFDPPFYVLKQLRAAGCAKLYHLKGGVAAWEASHLPIIQSLLEN